MEEETVCVTLDGQFGEVESHLAWLVGGVSCEAAERYWLLAC